MEVFTGHLRVDKNPDEDQRDEADNSGTRTRLFRVASYCAGYTRKMSLGQSTGEKSKSTQIYTFENNCTKNGNDHIIVKC